MQAGGRVNTCPLAVFHPPEWRMVLPHHSPLLLSLTFSLRFFLPAFVRRWSGNLANLSENVI